MIWKIVLGGLIIIILIIGITLAAIAALIGWSAGVGWIVTRFLPFTLFEATLLGMIASIFVFFFIPRILSIFIDEGKQGFSEEESNGSPYAAALPAEEGISPDRFVQSEEDETDEAWFRYQIANDIYDDLLAKLDLDATMGETQVKALAVRLVDVVTTAFKSRPKKPGHQRVTITVAQLKKQMDKMDLRPYDDDILTTTANAVNERLAYDDELADIVRRKTWRQRY